MQCLLMNLSPCRYGRNHDRPVQARHATAVRRRLSCLDEGAAASGVAGIPQDGDHEVGDNVLGEEVKKVLSVGIFPQPIFDDPEERIEGAKVFHPVDFWLAPRASCVQITA